MKRYTLGIAFGQDGVALVRKNRPEWQAGFFNFIGGKVEDGELPVDCMVREFREETGVTIESDLWIPVGRMFREDDFECHVFTTADVRVDDVRTVEDEEVILVSEVTFETDPELEMQLISNMKTLYHHAVSDDCLKQGAQLILEYPKSV